MERALADAVNALTARWLAREGEAASVVSGIGVWPLLALIAEPAEGPGRAELAAALGIPAEGAMDAARAVVAAMDASPAVKLATGLWTRRDLRAHEAWLDRLPEGTRGEITGEPDADAQHLDAWASERTGGRIARFPLRTNPDMRLILASALLVETEWVQSFTTIPGRLASGPWADGRNVGRLSRTSTRLDEIRVVDSACGPLTDTTVAGRGDVDVHLVLAQEQVAPERVLEAGAAAVTADGGVRGEAFTEDRLGPGISMQRAQSRVPQDELRLETVEFALAAEHDLRRRAEIFGLATVSDDSRGHFPGIADEPLAVGAANQSIVADFNARGFEAAAVTSLGIAVAAAFRPMQTHEIRVVDVAYHRPFAFYAVHRPTGLILAAGWVARPRPA
jgi:serine protease inhibitor